jgi:hypothetical protein
MLKPSEYTLNNSIITIYCNVNKFINFNLINKKFNKIIFSNYSNIEIHTETNNKFDIKYEKYWISNSKPQIFRTNKITHLVLNYYFNQPVILTNNLTFRERFHNAVILANNLTHLTFGDCFDQPVNLTDNLTHLSFGYYF